MQFRSRFLHAITLMAMLATFFVQPTVAQDASPLVPVYTDPGGAQFQNMTPGSTLSFSATVQNTSETESFDVSLSVFLVDWDYYSETVTVSPLSTQTLSLTVTQDEDLFPACYQGSAGVDMWINSNPDSGSIPSESFTVSCSVGEPQPEPQPVVIPTASILIEVCGADNDTWDPGVLPAGLASPTNTGWVNNQLTISYAPLDGYYIDGPTSQTLTDNNVPCTPVTPNAPFQTEVCGGNNDLVELAVQPEGIGNYTESGWGNGEYTVTYESTFGFEIPAGSEAFVLTDSGECEPTPAPTATQIPTIIVTPEPTYSAQPTPTQPAEVPTQTPSNPVVVPTQTPPSKGGDDKPAKPNPVTTPVPTAPSQLELIQGSLNPTPPPTQATATNSQACEVNRLSGQLQSITLGGETRETCNVVIPGMTGEAIIIDGNQTVVDLGTPSTPSNPVYVFADGSLVLTTQTDSGLVVANYPGAPVSIYGITASMQTAAPYASTTVDEQGVVDLSGIPAGDYRIVIAPDGAEEIEIFARIVSPEAVTGLPSTGSGSIRHMNWMLMVAGTVVIAAAGSWRWKLGTKKRELS